jgi:carboxyl-terminal processing protease
LDWNLVRAELEPKARAAVTVSVLRAVIEEMLNRLGDSHMALIPGDVAPASDESEMSGDGQLGMELRVIQDQVLVSRVDPNGAAAKAGVRPGWVLSAVGKHSVADLHKRPPSKLGPARAQFLAWRAVAGALSGAIGSSVRVQFFDGANQPVALTLTRQADPGERAKLGFMPAFYARLDGQALELPEGGRAGLIRFNLWMVPIIRALDQKIDDFRQLDGIIIDLRGNVGGLAGMILGVSGHFLGDRVSLGTLTMRGSELSFFANPRRVNAAGERVAPYSGPLAILTDRLSLSASEIFAGGMQALGRGRVFGETTGGQALPAIWDRLPNGDLLYHVFGDFVTASGVRVEGRGVFPDEHAPLTRDDLLAERDAPLLAAMRWISEQRDLSAKAKDGPR